MEANDLNVRTVNFLARVGGVERVKGMNLECLLKTAQKANLGKNDAIKLYLYLNN